MEGGSAGPEEPTESAIQMETSSNGKESTSASVPVEVNGALERAGVSIEAKPKSILAAEPEKAPSQNLAPAVKNETLQPGPSKSSQHEDDSKSESPSQPVGLGRPQPDEIEMKVVEDSMTDESPTTPSIEVASKKRQLSPPKHAADNKEGKESAQRQPKTTSEPVLKKVKKESPSLNTEKPDVYARPKLSEIPEPAMPAFPSPPKVGRHGSGLSHPGMAFSPVRVESLHRLAAIEPSSPGIFDDADEDETFDIEAYTPAPAAAVTRPDLVDIIMGSPAKGKFAMKLESKDQDKSEKKRKKTLKSRAKLFIAKKERDAAVQLLSGQVDLLKILPEEDCRFLGKNLWVFTLQQLECIINESGGTNGSRNLHRELIDKLARSKLVNNHKEEGPEAGPNNSTAKPLGSSVDIDEKGAIDSNQPPSSRPAREGSSPVSSTSKSNESVDSPGPETQSQSTVDVDPVASTAMTSESGSETPVPASAGIKSEFGIADVPGSPTGVPVSAPPPNSDGDTEISSGDTMSQDLEEKTSEGITDTKDESLTPIESAEKPNMNGSEISPPSTETKAKDSEIDKKYLEAAELKLESWKSAIEEWRNGSNTNDKALMKEMFPLDGPLSCLLPICALRFFGSVPIKTVFDFLCIKKTETGVVVDMLQLWRSKCNLSDVGRLALAKHLLGIGARIEGALGATPHCDANTRKWMSGSLVVLTGAAKDFLIDEVKLYSASDFIERKTKTLSEILLNWRISKSLPPLKGTGNVAMISGWKAIVKESMDIETGLGSVVTGVDFAKEAEVDESHVTREEKKARPSNRDDKKAVKPPRKPRKPEVELALNSPSFLSGIFKDEKLAAMTSVGITTAQHLLDAEKKQESPLIQAVIKMRTDSIKFVGSIQPNSCVRLIYDWCQRVQKRLDDVEGGKAKPLSKPSSKHVAKLPLGNASQVSTQKPEKKSCGPPRKGHKTPWDALSSSTVAFLSTMGISTAEEFLQTRTTDIANTFVAWREAHTMEVLKGLGATASVSGWKSQIRKAARSIGLEDVAALNPYASGSSCPVHIIESTCRSTSIDFEPLLIREMTEKGVLHGLSRRRFAVRRLPGTRGPSYVFELSVRKSSPTKLAKTGLHLTYLGSVEKWNTGSLEHTILPGVSLSADLPVLEDVTEALENPVELRNDPFSTLLPGLGVIELGKYGVKPCPLQDGSDTLKSELLKFVTDANSIDEETTKLESPDSSTNSEPDGNERSKPRSSTEGGAAEVNREPLESRSSIQSPSYNVFEKDGASGYKKFFLHLTKPIEMGQTVELRFLPSQPPSSGSDKKGFDVRRRRWLQEEISKLSLQDLRSLLDYLSEEVGVTIYGEVQKIFKKTSTKPEEETLKHDTAHATKIAISRRRMHWLALRINEQLQKTLQKNAGGVMSVVMPPVAITPLWTNDLVNSLREHPNWKSTIRTALMQEAGREILTEFSSNEFGGFAATRQIWCPMAERLFRSTVDKLAAFTTELGWLCTDDVLVQDLCLLVTAAATKVRSVVNHEGPAEASKFTDLVLTYRKGALHSSNAFPVMDEVMATSSSQMYLDAMDLCDEPACRPPVKDDWRVLATRVPSKENEILMQSVEDMKEGGASIDARWYIERQVLAIVQTVALCGVAHVAKNTAYVNLTDIKSKLCEAAKTAAEDPAIQALKLEGRPEKMEQYAEIPNSLPIKGTIWGAEYEPHSSPFFLGLMWPLLRQAGWKIEVGDDQSGVTYLPPGRNKARGGSHTKLAKLEKAKQRAKLANQTKNLGLGYIPKRIKRLFVNTASVDENAEPDESALSVTEALTQFFFSLQASLDEDKEGQKRVEEVVNQISTCFDELAPRLMYKEEQDRYRVTGNQRSCDVYGCEYLMRLLLVMPSMLQQSDLTVQQVDDTLGVVRELTNFMAINHSNLFDESFNVPQEHYDAEAKVPPFIVPLLMQLKTKTPQPVSEETTQGGVVTDDLKGILQPSDREVLTDFVELVLDQVIVCRATHDDVGKKNRRVAVGYPGLVCRHCFGLFGEGKYFFSSIESLTTATTVIEKHLAKCPKIDDEIKSNMIKYRTRHQEQRKLKIQGAQGAFFVRLWDRLRLSKASAGAEADVYVSMSSGSGKKSGSDDGESGGGSTPTDDSIEFKDHILLLEYLKATAPWKDKLSLVEAIDQYYNCLGYGGRIYNTNAMPVHFNSEWILSKVAPRSKPVK